MGETASLKAHTLEVDGQVSHGCAFAGARRLVQMKAEYLLPCVHHFYKNPPQIVAGRGAQLFDDQGHAYIDCLSGVGVMNAGHCEPAIIEPAIEQIRSLQHTSTILLTEPQLRLAQRLVDIAPSTLTKSFFCASGSEAVEAAMLLATLHTGRPKIIAFADSLHGHTRRAMTATGLPMWRADPFPTGDIVHIPFGEFDALCAAIEAHSGQIAAVLGEPIQGNGGINVPAQDWWPQVRDLCNEHRALLIFDEVQTGFNRTGRWFACDHWGVAPDVLAMSKGLGNGFPIAAIMTTDTVARSCTRPSASTYGGNPMCAAAALATIEFHIQSELGRRSATLGARLITRLHSIAKDHQQFLSPPRGRGLMCGLPIHHPDPLRAAEICDRLLERLKDARVLAGKTGRSRNVLTFLPPLVIGEAQLAQVCDSLCDAVGYLRLA